MGTSDNWREPAAWRAHAACRGTDVNLWFPAPGAPSASPLEQQRVADAKAVCAECPVQLECLEYAMEEPCHHGVWGGQTERERRRLHTRDIRHRKYLTAKARGSGS